MSDGILAALGWTDELEAAFTTYVERGFRFNRWMELFSSSKPVGKVAGGLLVGAGTLGR